MTQAYVYKWTELSTKKWYIGCRSKKDCHPNDGYICSSKLVKPMILANPSNWERQIIEIGSPDDMLELEAEILELFDARNDPMSYNLHNGDSKFSTAGKKLGSQSEEHRAKRSASMKGKNKGKKLGPRSEETCVKISVSLKGKPKPKFQCPHCGKECSPNNLSRWHGDNCKMKPKD